MKYGAHGSRVVCLDERFRRRDTPLDVFQALGRHKMLRSELEGFTCALWPGMEGSTPRAIIAGVDPRTLFGGDCVVLPCAAKIVFWEFHCVDLVRV